MAALVFRDDFLHDLDDGHVVEGLGHLHQPAFVLTGRLVVVAAGLGDLDLRVGGRKVVFLVGKDFLVEFLAVTQTGELDLDVLGTGEGDHPLCEIHDPDRLAHVEDEDLTALAHRAGLEHKFAGLRDEHEEADDVRMGDGDRASVADLLPEDRNDAAVGAEDVAEAGGDELGDTLDLALLDGLIEALAVDFAYSFAAPHDVGRVDRLVGGDHHELLRAVLDCEVRDDAGAVDVVLDRDCRVVLHHRDVLVGGRMEDIFRLVLSEDALHVVLVGDAGDDGLVRNVGVVPCHHQTDVVHRGLCLVDEHHLCRMVLGHLTDHLGTDRSGRSGDHYPRARQQGSDRVHVDFDLVPRKQVLDGDFVEAPVAERGSLAVPFLLLRHHHDLDVRGEELVDHLLVLTEGVALQR